MAKILIGYSACELTRKAFEQQGHEAWTCDELPARGEGGNHIQGDIWFALTAIQWDMAVLHPMCTFLTCSAAWALMDANFEKYPGVGYHQKTNPEKLYGAERRAAQAVELENFRKLLDLPFPVAIENPGTSAINTAIRPPDQVVHPYHFGDDASKGTGFWLTKGLPKLIIDPAHYVKPRLVCKNKHTFQYGQSECPECGTNKFLPRWANQTDGGQNKLTPSDSRWLDRSKTYPGIAAAMGAQWGRFIAESTKAEVKAA